VRVVSLVPSLTETLLAWGITPVGVTRFCEQPALTAVGGTKDPDVARIAALAPDVVLVDREESRREDAEALSAAGIALHVTHVRSVADVEPTLEALAVAVGLDRRPAPPETEGDACSVSRAEQWRPGPELGAWSAPPPAPLRAFVPIWRRPWMTLSARTYGASALAAVGVEVVFADRPEPYPTVELPDVSAAGANAVLLPTEPYPFSARHVGALASELGLPARLVDGRDLFWWGARTPAALVRLRQSIGP
jgi:ABC-type Fe3+-hydroxamate transport system substrate-binding protein